VPRWSRLNPHRSGPSRDTRTGLFVWRACVRTREACARKKAGRYLRQRPAGGERDHGWCSPIGSAVRTACKNSKPHLACRSRNSLQAPLPHFIARPRMPVPTYAKSYAVRMQMFRAGRKIAHLLVFAFGKIDASPTGGMGCALIAHFACPLLLPNSGAMALFDQVAYRPTPPITLSHLVRRRHLHLVRMRRGLPVRLPLSAVGWPALGSILTTLLQP